MVLHGFDPTYSSGVAPRASRRARDAARGAAAARARGARAAWRRAGAPRPTRTPRGCARPRCPSPGSRTLLLEGGSPVEERVSLNVLLTPVMCYITYPGSNYFQLQSNFTKT